MSDEQKHTPGPWKADQSQVESGTWVVRAPQPVYVTTDVVAVVNTPRPTNIADAHLIAAAPEMLEVLKTWTHDGSLQTFESRERFRVVALAVIAKAEGREP